MKFQFKKEWLIKYKFWIMLAAIPPAALAALYILEGVVGAEHERRSKDLLQKTKDAKNPLPSPQYNQQAIDALKKEVERVQKEEANVWKTAYKEQEPLFVLPPKFQAECNFATGLFAEDIRVFSMAPPKGNAPPPPPPPPGTKAKDAPKIEELAIKKLKEMPPDQAQVVYGRVVDINQVSVTIQDRKQNRIKFGKTPTVKVTDPQKKAVHWNRILLNDILTVFYQTGKYFGDPSTDAEQLEWFKYYKTQLPAVINQLDPLDPVKGEGVVQLGDWTFDKLEQLRTWAKADDDETAQPPPPSKAFRFLPRFTTGKGNNDASDDIWIAEEDLWIQSEMFRLIRLANDYVSKFAEDKRAENNMEGTFHNTFWEVTLKLSADKKHLTAKFTNLLPRRQKIDFKLKIVMSNSKNAEPEVVEFRQEPLLQPHKTKGGGDTKTLEVDLKPRGTRSGIFKVEQVLTWETAAVRRVDGVYIGKMGGVNANGHRTFPDPLVPYPNRHSPAPPATGGTAPATKDKDNKPAAFAKGGKTPNQQDRERYLETPEQLRRLPVALVLIVEQSQVDRVQTAFNNSRFRFLTTQVLLNHYSGSMRPPTVEKLPAGAEAIKGGAKDVPMKQPLIRVARGPAAAGVNDEMEVNMEMVIYGIITIYEKIPGRAKNPLPN